MPKQIIPKKSRIQNVRVLVEGNRRPRLITLRHLLHQHLAVDQVSKLFFAHSLQKYGMDQGQT